MGNGKKDTRLGGEIVETPCVESQEEIRNKLLSKGKQKHVSFGEKLGEGVQKRKGTSPSPSPPNPPIPIPISKIKNTGNPPSGDSIPAGYLSRASARSNNKETQQCDTSPAADAPETANKTSKLSSKMIENSQKIKDARKAIRVEKRNLPQGKMDYEKLDLLGNPKISFDPKSKYRKHAIEILELKTHGKKVDQSLATEKKLLTKKLGIEFSRIYKRYRNLLYASKNLQNQFTMPPDSEKYCIKIAIQCIYNGISPRQLLEYWDVHIKNFVSNGINPLSFPTLHFLSGPFAAAQVASALYETTSGDPKTWKSGDFAQKVPTHSFFNVKELDKRLRMGLKEAGFDVIKYDDRYLLTVQKTALAIVNGKNIFVGGVLKKMVDWAIENLYGDSDEND